LTTKPLYVYSKDLELVSGKVSEPIFNPTFKICVLQPGSKIVIKGIYISSGYGKYNAAFQRARCATYKHLDIPQYDRTETHNQNGSMVDNSGYKISSLEANPKHHIYKCIIVATNNDPAEVKSIFIDTCINIKERLRYILSHVESINNNERTNHEIEYSIFQLNDGIFEGILLINNETHTIGELLKRSIYELIPDIINVKYIILSHEDKLKLTIQYKEHVTKILIKALRHCISIFDSLQKQFVSYKI
jgi:DNA-directed RNA polymerase subunit L